jgi:ferritin-like metal-binding protein YciE
MSSQIEKSKIETEIKLLESSFESFTDSRLREITEIRIKECRERLRRIQAVLRSNLKSPEVSKSCSDKSRP